MTGSRVELGIGSDTLGAVARQFVASRDAYRRRPAWRSRKKGNLGWVPLNAARAFKIDEDHGAVVLLGRLFRLWFSRPLERRIKTAAFCEDGRGRWYFNVQFEIAKAPAKDGPSVGVDLGLHHLAALSDGRKIKMPAFCRRHEKQLALAQQLGQKMTRNCVACQSEKLQATLPA
jgi:putative transposase